MSQNTIVRCLSFIAACFVVSLFGCQSTPQANNSPAPQSSPFDTLMDQALLDYGNIHHPVIGRNGMVASQEKRASQIGADILKAGGNAIDAGVAVGFALAVTLPRAGNIAGGGFMLIHDADSGETIAIDYKEKAPQSASRDMFVNEDGTVDEAGVRFSHRSFGVPGTVDALVHVLEKYGTMTLAEVLQPAIRLAEEGFPVTDDMAFSLTFGESRMRNYPASQEIFFGDDGKPLGFGELLVQADLAWSLKRIAEFGRDGFYSGEVAKRIVAEMKAGGGLVTLDDLRNYHSVERPLVRSNYRGYELAMMPPPSSGGVLIAQMLKVMEKYPLADMGANSSATVQVMAEAMRQAYADRAAYLGDPDFVDNPVEELTSVEYAERTYSQIEPGVARKSADVRAAIVVPRESPDTTHFSVMDKYGNAVANTYSLNYSYGNGIVVPGTGILLNNVMDDFSANPGTPNAYGLLGGEANSIQPGKRALSSMTPTMLLKDGVPILATGSPGGSTIITSILQHISNIIDHDMNVLEALVQPRFHHQWYPDELYVEPGFSKDSISILQSMGYEVTQRKFTSGSIQSVMFENGIFFGGSDPRRPDAAAIGY